MPTRAQSGALTASFSAPTGKVEPSAFFDEDAEAVRQKHLEERAKRSSPRQSQRQRLSQLTMVQSECNFQPNWDL